MVTGKLFSCFNKVPVDNNLVLRNPYSQTVIALSNVHAVQCSTTWVQ